jgi:GNAT superfamily N-acetyltransferase
MLELTRPVWDGNDYVPFKWKEWLRDGEGRVSVAVAGGTLVGLQHIAIQPDGTAWLEGIRVRDEAQARGVGRTMLEEGLEWARRTGYPRARLCTYGGNPASNRLAVKGGMREIRRIRVLEGTPASASCDGCRPALPSDAEVIQRYLREAHDAPGLYCEGWTALTLDENRLHLLLASHAVMVSGATAIDGLMIATSKPSRPRLCIGYLHGSVSAVRTLARVALGAAASAGFERVVAIAPLTPQIYDALMQDGWEWRNQVEMVLYEREFY